MTPTRSAVIVVVAGLEPLVAQHRRALEVSASWGVPAHVTVLYPFVAPGALGPEVHQRLARAVGQVDCFEATFARTGRFGPDVLFLAPEPQGSFRALTGAVCAAFPDHPPYDGAFDDLVPHLSVGHDQPLERLRGAETDLLPGLPVSQRICEVSLWTGHDAVASWSRVATLPLGRHALR
ncbi:MAG: 2'-5' RNA ligase family protein [Nocardioides sp.]|nr:2'-5' RNA ligase family protein [Nocardioides sp.]